MRSESRSNCALEEESELDFDENVCPRFLEEGKKLIICCVRKPVLMSKSKSGDAWEYTVSRSGFKSAIDHIATTNAVKWVSWAGAVVDPGTQVFTHVA